MDNVYLNRVWKEFSKVVIIQIVPGFSVFNIGLLTIGCFRCSCPWKKFAQNLECENVTECDSLALGASQPRHLPL